MSSLSIIITCLIVLQSCGTSKKKSDNPQADETQAVEQSANDTIPKPVPPPVSELGPGQAKVMGNMVSQKNNILHLQVSEVQEYGSSTPPIATNDTLSIQVADTLLDLKNDATLIIQRTTSSGSSKIPGWSLIKLDN